MRLNMLLPDSITIQICVCRSRSIVLVFNGLRGNQSSRLRGNGGRMLKVGNMIGLNHIRLTGNGGRRLRGKGSRLRGNGNRLRGNRRRLRGNGSSRLKQPFLLYVHSRVGVSKTGLNGRYLSTLFWPCNRIT